MADPNIEAVLIPLRDAVRAQKKVLETMKAENAPEIDLKREVQKMKALQKDLETKVSI